jgi:large subunit ribosomal protein L31
MLIQGRKKVNPLKPSIHPQYNVITASCACGNTFETGSIKSNLKVEICSACHPFYTGKQKFIDAGGRVDKFKKKYGI